MEHFACFETLARALERPLAAFTYAGVKDKVAVTSQLVVVQGVEPTALLAVNRTSDGIRVGDLAFVGAPMVRSVRTGRLPTAWELNIVPSANMG